jgi:precorrin-6A synthase
VGRGAGHCRLTVDERGVTPARRLLVVGIGAGDPGFVTAQAVEALGGTDVVLVIDKGEEKDELAAVRREVLARFVPQERCRIVTVHDTVRDPALRYEDAVERWHGERVERLERALLDEVTDGETTAILVWGDPGLYDSTLRLVGELRRRGRIALEVEVVPGISSLQVLAAQHGIALNQVGRSLLVTTGRRLREDGVPSGIDDVVVVLDGGTAFTTLAGAGFDIYWGAYLGLPDEVLVAGPLDEVAAGIAETKAAARARKGWVFDTYLLRRRTTS